MNINSILAKSIQKGKEKAKKAEKLATRTAVRIKSDSEPVKKVKIPGISSSKYDAIIAKHLKKKKKKKEQTKLRRTKPENREPDFRISFDFIMSIYEKINATPMRAVYWYEYPFLKRDWTNEDRSEATPLAAMCLLRYKDLPSQDDVREYQIRHSKFIDKPSHTWVAGSVSQLLSTLYTGMTCSYLLGFKAGFDGNKKWDTFHMMSLVYTRGFEDGHAILNQMLEKGLVTTEGSIDDENDIYENEEDEHALRELYRIRGYKRDGFDPYSKTKFISEEEQRKKSLKKVFNNGEIKNTKSG